MDLNLTGTITKKKTLSGAFTPAANRGKITVDDALSDTSENPVQNKVIKAALDAKGTYSKPSGGIPASDLAAGVIPTVPSASITPPADLGTAAAGNSTKYARADHVHKMPSATDVGAIMLPAFPRSGQVLTWDGSAWIPENPAGVPSAYASNPAMDGTASPGSTTAYARGDHVHPSDTSKADKVTEVTIAASGTVMQLIDDGKIYHFTGTMTSLRIELNAPSYGQLAEYHFDFLSGSSAPTVTMPSAVTMPDDFTVEANRRYEVDILNGYGAVMSWAIS